MILFFFPFELLLTKPVDFIFLGLTRKTLSVFTWYPEVQNPCFLKIAHASVIFSFITDMYFHGQNSSNYLSVRLVLSTYSYQDTTRQVCDHAASSEAWAEHKQNKNTELNW